MFSNYIKIALRNLQKNKLFSLVNVCGLSVGIAASLMLFLYIKNELSYDKFLQDGQNIYRLRCDNLNAGEYSERMAVTNCPVAQTIRDMFPEVQYVVQINKDDLGGLMYTDKFKFRIKNGFLASEDFFKIFSHKAIRGDLASALKEPGEVVLTQSLAKKFFGEGEAVGKTIHIGRKSSLKVTAVIEDVPANTHMKFDLLVSSKTHSNPEAEKEWDANETYYTYLKLKPGTNAALLEKKFAGMVEKKIGPYLKGKNHDKQYFLQPLTSIHLDSHYDSEMEANGDRNSIYFFIVIASLILFIAWINYINLAIARSFERFKEVGIRMVSGASKLQLQRQFVFEAILLNLIAVCTAILTVRIMYPYFSDYTGLTIRTEIWNDKKFWLIFSFIVIAGAIVSSIYPAFVLTSINPVKVLKSTKGSLNKGFPFKRLLITFQFVISISLIIGTIIVHKQVSSMKEQDPGVSIGQTLIIHRPSIIDSTWTEKLNALKNDLTSDPEIKQICISRYVPGETIDYSQGFVRKSNTTDNSSQLLYSNFFDNDFIKLYGLKLIAGRDFINGRENLEIIINQKALKRLNFKTPEDAIGQTIYNEGWKRVHTIVGVIENFHQRSVKEDYLPMAYMHFAGPQLSNKFSVKIETKNMKETLAKIEKSWNLFFPGNAFEYFFLDEHYNNQFKSDIQFGRVFLMFSVLAILIACVGLFALTLYTFLLRSKEIAVRKVVGASTIELFKVLTKEYFILVLVSAVVAIPAMYWVMTAWLRNYSYRVNLNAYFFLAPVLILFLIVLLSVSFQVLKVIKANPIKSLRTE